MLRGFRFLRYRFEYQRLSYTMLRVTVLLGIFFVLFQSCKRSHTYSPESSMRVSFPDSIDWGELCRVEEPQDQVRISGYLEAHWVSSVHNGSGDQFLTLSECDESTTKSRFVMIDTQIMIVPETWSSMRVSIVGDFSPTEGGQVRLGVISNVKAVIFDD